MKVGHAVQTIGPLLIVDTEGTSEPESKVLKNDWYHDYIVRNKQSFNSGKGDDILLNLY